MSTPTDEADEARELAKRWAWWHAFDKADHPQAAAAAEVDAWLESIGQAERVLHEPDRERLFVWVRMVADAIPDEVSASRASIIGANLRLDDVQAAALLCAAGWPS